eukprot:Blabericola_migrator_1__2169@NODE_159_length_12571_cov_158_810301_g139_i0_p8_GENE_NODE_159_length_12571_cov_158_810301_g139_i0NODE_159_length_12571_cov_158_810301_g139_i0_p8_ORF_typecomplete_len114_score27_88RED_N/PF07808_13/0_074YabA/PF06156_13/0_17_NODE_159_length_12571_cov_158_810301_g139_i073067647
MPALETASLHLSTPPSDSPIRITLRCLETPDGHRGRLKHLVKQLEEFLLHRRRKRLPRREEKVDEENEDVVLEDTPLDESFLDDTAEEVLKNEQVTHVSTHTLAQTIQTGNHI